MNNYGFLRLILPFFMSTAIAAVAAASVPAPLLDGRSLLPVTASQIIERIRPGSVLILGENHGIAAHRDQHLTVLNLLRQQGFKVSVGMEFINYTDQPFVNQYLAKQLDEDAFLKAISWQGFPFEFYKQQILFPNLCDGELTLGLNVPRTITSKIAKTGLDSLSVDERQLLPIDFTLGRDSYKARFAKIMHVPPGPALDRYFTAQSAWDDTMAFQAVKFLDSNPKHVLVIIVGEFHLQYGGGLADRILARQPNTNIVSVSQVWAVNFLADGSEVPMTEAEIQKEITPSDSEGPRGDFLWISKPLAQGS